MDSPYGVAAAKSYKNTRYRTRYGEYYKVVAKLGCTEKQHCHKYLSYVVKNSSRNADTRYG